MNEILSDVKTAVKEFLDGPRTDMQRSIHRTAAFDAHGYGLEIEQTKFVMPEDLESLRAKGALALATSEWLNDVEWIADPFNQERNWRQLSLDATYPIEYFDVHPGSGSFLEGENGLRWLDQYGSISGFGNDNKIHVYVPRFVAPGEKSVTELRYPDDPTAMEQYNARYLQYLRDLNQADPTVSYYRGWDYGFSKDAEQDPKVLNGMWLAGLGLNEVLYEGATNNGKEVDTTRILLGFKPEQNGYLGRDIVIVGDEAITEPYRDGEDDEEPASEQLLKDALELVRNLNLIQTQVTDSQT